MTNDIDLLLMTETWLTAGDAVIRATLKSANYDLNDTPRPSGRLGGGVGIIYKRGMCHKMSYLRITLVLYFLN